MNYDPNDVIISNGKNYYYGDNVSVVVTDNFGQASIISINPNVDVKSGKYLFQYNDSDWYTPEPSDSDSDSSYDGPILML